MITYACIQLAFIVIGVGFYVGGAIGKPNKVLTGGIIGAIASMLTLAFFEEWVMINVPGDEIAKGWGWLAGSLLGGIIGYFQV